MESQSTQDGDVDASSRVTLNFMVSRHRLHLFEFGDQSFIPRFLRRREQSVLSSQWKSRIPLLQKVSPAKLAADQLCNTIEIVAATSDSKLTVVDFCAGSGGPTPVIEQLINEKRSQSGLEPIQFVLTDARPHISDWMKLSEQSDFLSFIPQPVDASNPPISVISEDSPQNNTQAEFSSDSRVFRLFFLSFHHFDDDLAAKILASSLETADGFAIFELQDRRVFSLIIMLLEPIFILLVAIFWFIKDPLLLIFTYIIPILPPMLAFDGLVSCLRTRTFDEIMELVDSAAEDRFSSFHGDVAPASADKNRKRVGRGQWTFEGGSALHTRPFGHMSWFIGWRNPQGRTDANLIDI